MNKYLAFVAGHRTNLQFMVINLSKQRYIVCSKDPGKSAVYVGAKSALRELSYQLDTQGFEQVENWEEMEL